LKGFCMLQIMTTKVKRQVLFLALAVFSFAIHAQSYPNKRVSFLVPWPAGGATDVAARLLGAELQNTMGQPFVVENTAGAGGSIGTTKALKAPADGYTLLMSSQQDLVLSPYSYKSADFKHEDAQTVALVGYTSVMVVVRPSLPAQTLQELVALMKSSSAKPLSFCTPGTGTIYPLMVERMNSQLGTKNLQVPYPGFGQCLTDLAGDRIDFAFLPIAGPFPDFVENGKIRGLAVLSDKPNVRFPKMPLASSIKGFENLNFALWSAVHVNASVPAPIVEQLNKAITAAMAKPEMRKSIEAQGATVFAPMTAQQAHAFYLNDAKSLGAAAVAVGFTKQ
jgi:tripartite-type tricarboxylate transporter receptor subunit TctC